MKAYNPNKKIAIEIHQNSPSGTDGYTVWRMDGMYKDAIRKDAISRRADGKDFDWMTDSQAKSFEEGHYRFIITQSQAIEYFNYIA